MDTTAIITGIALIAIVLVPLILHHQGKKNTEVRFLKDITTLAEKENAIISQKEIWRDCYAIALDEKSKILFYLNKLKHKEQKTVVDLFSIEKCRVATTSRNVRTNGGINLVIDRLDLILTFNRSDIPEKVLEFYDNDEFMTPDGELPLVEKWQCLINSQLKKGNK